jgi:hypothetical protein
MQPLQVTQLRLVGSDAQGVQQLAVMLSSGAILFYDLALYCVPGAAWHPDCCVVASGHVGRVTCSLEVAFKCPPQQLLGCPGSAAAAAAEPAAASGPHGSLAHAVNAQASGHTHGTLRAASSHASSAASAATQQQPAGATAGLGAAGIVHCGVVTAAAAQCPPPGSSERPAQGALVPLLLTGGRDGSVRGWDLRCRHLGQPWMAVHPHTAPVDALVLPPVASRLPWSCCVLSVCAAGRVALSCLATGTLKRCFDGWSLGPPAQLAWSTSR